MLGAQYSVSDAYSVPSRSSLTFGATAKRLWCRVLYIDIRNSKSLVSKGSSLDALKVHKGFLYSVAKCVRAEGGEPRSFNGDSVLSFFPGKKDDAACSAVRSAMKIRYAIEEILDPELKKRFDLTLDSARLSPGSSRHLSSILSRRHRPGGEAVGR